MPEIDVKDFKIPDGYILIKDPVVENQKIIDKEIADLEILILEPEPSLDELAEFGKLYHPYYENVRRLDDLKKI